GFTCGRLFHSDDDCGRAASVRRFIAHLLRVGWLPGRFREQPLDHLFDLAVQSAMRKAIRRAFLGFQLGPPKQNFVTCETDGNGRFAMQKSEAVSVSDGLFRFILFPSSQHRREGLFSGKRKSFSRSEPLPLLNPSGHAEAFTLDLPTGLSTDRAMEAWYHLSIA